MVQLTAGGAVQAFGPGEGRESHIAGDRFFTKGSASQRSEAFSVIEYEGAPGVPGPPAHRHRTFEEAWFILEGEVTFTADGRTIAATLGTYLFVPRGVAHAFQVAGTRRASWLGIFSPGRYVGLVEELGALIPADGPPNVAALARLFAKYDSEILDAAGSASRIGPRAR